jgi:hypothetical protein
MMPYKMTEDIYIPTYDDLVDITEEAYDIDFWWDEYFDSEEDAMRRLGFLLAVNTFFVFVFALLWLAAIYLAMSRDIDDLFVRYSLNFLIFALFLRTLCCLLASLETEEDYLKQQTIFGQQVYFEIPFYCFTIVIMSILFSMQEFYMVLNLSCKQSQAIISRSES